MFVCISRLVNIDVCTCVCRYVWLHRLMTRDSGTVYCVNHYQDGFL